MVKYYYSKEHDILVSGNSMDDIRECVEYQVAPTFCMGDGCSFDNMGFVKITADEAEHVAGEANVVVWEAS